MSLVITGASGLRALVARRAGIAERLAFELDERAFLVPELDDFDPDADITGGRSLHLSPMEALLLDIAVAPSDPEQSWLTYPQASELFAADARKAQRRADRARTQTAVGYGVVALASGTALALALLLAGVSSLLVVCCVLTWVLAGLAGASRMAPVRTPRLDAVGGALVVGALCAALNAINQSLTRPAIPDATGLIAGALIPAIAAVVLAYREAPRKGLVPRDDGGR